MRKDEDETKVKMADKSPSLQSTSTLSKKTSNKLLHSHVIIESGKCQQKQMRKNEETLVKKPPTRTKKLIKGDSLMRGISRKGLNRNVFVKTIPGGKLADVENRLQREELDTYSDIIIYVGGNDVSVGET